MDNIVAFYLKLFKPTESRVVSVYIMTGNYNT